MYGHTRSLHDALPISGCAEVTPEQAGGPTGRTPRRAPAAADHKALCGDRGRRAFLRALPRRAGRGTGGAGCGGRAACRAAWRGAPERSEEHTSELQSLMRISYAVFCLTKKKYI